MVMMANATSTWGQSGSISLRNISKVFIDAAGHQVNALQKVNLEIHPGEFVCLLGPSGCGKSTLLRLIAGLEQPDDGELFLDDDKITKPHYSRGLVFQDPTLFPWRTVRENVATGLHARGIPWRKGTEVDDYIKLVGLVGFENSYPYQLSGGMAQRAALARALVNHPKVLLLDEPLGALDAFTRMGMQDEILRIWHERATTMVFVTHDIDEAVYLSDRIVVMTPRPGKITKIISVDLGRPRARNHPDFLRLRTEVLELLHLAQEISTDYYL
jgi:NitT/TauT family transport system ATP-binding protein/sulfonate transport system ATP-binding protein